jgi:uncharacterized membrane protein
MIQLHPPCSGMPLAFVILLVVVEVMALCRPLMPVRGIRAVVVAACMLATLVAFLTGYQASSGTSELSEVQKEVLSIHHSLGKLLLCNVVLLGTWCFVLAVAKERLRTWRALYLLALVIQLTLTAWVGFLGGELVFRHGVGLYRGASAPPSST